MEVARLIALAIFYALGLWPAFVIPKKEWDIECWFVSGGAIWLLFAAGGVAHLIRYLFY